MKKSTPVKRQHKLNDIVEIVIACYLAGIFAPFFTESRVKLHKKNVQLRRRGKAVYIHNINSDLSLKKYFRQSRVTFSVFTSLHFIYVHCVHPEKRGKKCPTSDKTLVTFSGR